MEREVVAYVRQVERWSPQCKIRIEDESEKALLFLSTEFLRVGKVNNFHYILHCLQMAFFTDDGHFVFQGDGQRVEDLDAAPSAGTYTYHSHGSAEAEPLAPRKGPRFKFGHRPPAPHDDGASTMSDSDRSSIEQNDFRLLVFKRDGGCLLSREYTSRLLTAAHILPASRPEYYREVMGLKPQDHIFINSADCGLTLRSDFHRKFDVGYLALYPAENGDWIVHMFNRQKEDVDHHGQVISHETFRCDEEDLPNRDLLMFHYQQCVIKSMRCYSHWPA
ncbi:unnamed protein product [Parajaminaea phylloscopi]